MTEIPTATAATLLLDDRIRGVPPGTDAFPAASVAKKNWHPAEGVMALPVLTLDEAVFARNRDLMLAYGASTAPRSPRTRRRRCRRTSRARWSMPAPGARRSPTSAKPP